MFDVGVSDDLRESLTRQERANAAAVVAAVGWVRSAAWLADGARSAVTWLIARQGLHQVEARRLVRRARLVDALDFVGLLEAGEISIGQIDVLVDQILGDDDRVALAREQRDIIRDWCKLDHLGDTDKAARHWRALADDVLDSGDPDRAHVRRGLWLNTNLFGEVEIFGRADAESGAIIEAAIEAAVTADPVEIARTPDQRRLDALADICRHHLDCSEAPDLSGSRATGEPIVIIDRYGHVEYHGQPMTPSFADRVLCDSRIAAAWRDDTANELRFGRTRRTPTDALRRAVIVRDRHCQFPGCRIEHPRCHIHHIDEWSHGGGTDIDNLVLVCRWHHRLVHEGGWTLRGSPAGHGLAARSPDGRILHPH